MNCADRTQSQNRTLAPPPAALVLQSIAFSGFTVFRTLAIAILVLPLLAQEPAKNVPEEGIPVTNQLVIDKCSPCHQKDAKGNLTRISWERTTPEGWQQAIKRMVRLHGVTLTPEDARSIVRYLSSSHGLAPEEARPALYQIGRAHV